MIWPFARRSDSEDSVGAITERGPFLPDRFAFKALRELVRANDTSNVFWSPFSVMLCLMMLWEGATGETRETMAKVLEIVEDPEGYQRFLKAALAISSPGLELAIANSLWCDEQARVLPAFLTIAREKYAAKGRLVTLSKSRRRFPHQRLGCRPDSRQDWQYHRRSFSLGALGRS